MKTRFVGLLLVLGLTTTVSACGLFGGESQQVEEGEEGNENVNENNEDSDEDDENQNSGNSNDNDEDDD